MAFSCFHHPPSPSALRARSLQPPSQEGQGIMVFLSVPSREVLRRVPRAGAEVRCVAKTPPSLAHSRSTSGTSLVKRFEFWARTFCPVFFQPHTKIAASGAQNHRNCSKSDENHENFAGTFRSPWVVFRPRNALSRPPVGRASGGRRASEIC